MNDSENRTRQAFSRAHDFGLAHASDFAPTSLATQLFATRADIVSEWNGHAARRVSSRGSAFEELNARASARRRCVPT